MTAYMQALMNVCFTMVTGVIIVGCLGAMLFFALAIWEIIDEHIN